MSDREEVRIICKEVVEELLKDVITNDGIIEEESPSDSSEQPPLSLANALECLTEESAKEIFGDEAKDDKDLSKDTSKVIASFFAKEKITSPIHNSNIFYGFCHSF